MTNADAFVEARAGKQECAHELTRRGGIDDNIAAADASLAVDSERQCAEAAIGNVDAELTKGLDDGQHRAHSGALITVERNVSLGEGCYRRHESHHSSGESDVDDGWSG